MKRDSLKLFALGGVAGPILFTLITLIFASLRPGYSHISQFISELGATGTPNAEMMNIAGFIPTGTMIALFGLSLFVLLPNRFLPRTGSILLILFGIGCAVAGFFSCDPGCPREGSLENNIHDQVSGLAFLLAIIGKFMLGISFRRIPFWRRLWVYSVVSALFSLGIFLALVDSLESYTYTGMWQRLLLIALFSWIGITGLNAFRSFSNNKVGKEINF